MPTDVLVEKTETQSPPDGRPDMTITDGRLGNDFFGVENKQEEKPIEAKPPETVITTPETKKEEEEEEILEPKDWLKRELGVDDVSVLKAEREEYTKLKSQTPAEVKYENEQSKKVHQLLQEGKVDEVLDIYSKQKSIDKAISLEVNKDTAADIIKLSMQLKYPTLTKDQIDFQYRQDYGIPKEPVIKETDDPDEFNERHQEWEEKVANVQMKATIAATMAKPELEQAKTKIVLPDIQEQVQQKPLTQEELDGLKKYQDAYLQSVDNSMKEFNGFSVTVKNEDVGLPETPIAYTVIESEKAALTKQMKDFATEGNFNANSLFAERWVNEDKTLNTKLIAEDRYWLENRSKIIQKMTNDAATKAIESYIKGKKNININETSQPGTALLTKEDKTQMDEIRDKIFG